MGLASDSAADRHQHKGNEQSPPQFSHGAKNDSAHSALRLRLYSVYGFCPQPLFTAQWGLKGRGSGGGRMNHTLPGGQQLSPQAQHRSSENWEVTR